MPEGFLYPYPPCLVIPAKAGTQAPKKSKKRRRHILNHESTRRLLY